MPFRCWPAATSVRSSSGTCGRRAGLQLRRVLSRPPRLMCRTALGCQTPDRDLPLWHGHAGQLKPGKPNAGKSVCLCLTMWQHST